MTTPTDDFPAGIGAPARRALHAAGYANLSEVADVPSSDLAALHGVGPKAVRLIREAVDEANGAD